MLSGSLKSSFFVIFTMTISCIDPSVDSRQKAHEEPANSQGQSYDGEAILITEEDLKPVTAKPLTPISGTYLTFTLDKEWADSEVDAYIVGLTDSTHVQTVTEGVYEVLGVPEGTHELIVTARQKGHDPQQFSAGIRRSVRVSSETNHIGRVGLMEAIRYKKQGLMNGINSFEGVTASFPGTKLQSLSFDPYGDSSETILVQGNPHPLQYSFAGSLGRDTDALTVDENKQVKGAKPYISARPHEPTNFSASDAGPSTLFQWTAGSVSSSKTYTVFGWPNEGFLKTTIADGTDYSKHPQVLYHGNGTEFSLPKDQATTYFAYSIIATNDNLMHSSRATILESRIQRLGVYRYYRIMIENVVSTCFRGMYLSSLEFKIGSNWQKNTILGEQVMIGQRLATVSSTPGVNRGAPSAAFGDTSQLWGTYHAAYDLLSELPPTGDSGLWLQVDFGDRPAAISGMSSIGGYMPSFTNCAPSKWKVYGSNDQSSWTYIPGSAVTAAKGGKEHRYLFAPDDSLNPSPYGLKVVARPSENRLSWKSPTPGQTKFLVYRSRRPDDFRLVNGTDYADKSNEMRSFTYVTGTFFTDQDIKPSVPYYYAVYAVDANGNFSNPVLGFPQARKPIAARYWRVNLDSVMGGGYQKSFIVDHVSFAVNDQMTKATSDNETQGLSFASYPFSVRSSSAAQGADPRDAFVNDGIFWESAKESVYRFFPFNARNPEGEWLEVQFLGDSIPDVSGLEIAGLLNYTNVPVLFSAQQKFADQFRIQYSEDGKTWKPVMDEPIRDFIAGIRQYYW